MTSRRRLRQVTFLYPSVLALIKKCPERGTCRCRQMLNTSGSGTQTHCDRAHAIRRADKELRGIFTCGGYVFRTEDCAVASRICVMLLRRARIQSSSPTLIVTVRGARLSARA
ncbi:Major surface-labeled trophozoite antigen precursor [Giardia duodenalis assemblage B]|uniref:Major surface-labeled trophozoite antigen n=1 Tax=Giardia duodenalis assemblage B TaxID=1394984 RepID=A0A132P031_GIAIN|nr:Major surface-labeled trophozoite antigen precursor [Giardia intestinalis assemblage B]